MKITMNETDNTLRMFPDTRNIPEIKPKTFILFPKELNYKQSESLEIKQRESLELIKNHLKIFKKCFVASSHGHDSIVLVHLITRACKALNIPMIDVWLNHTLNIYKEEPEYWKKINKFLSIENNFRIFYPPKLANGKQATVYSIAESVGHLPTFRKAHNKTKNQSFPTPECCHILKKQSVNSYLKQLPLEHRYDCHFVGTLAIESRIRRLGVLQRCRSYLTKYDKPYKIQTVTPLSFWLKKDIADYMTMFQIPLNPAYTIHNQQRLGCASCPAHKNWELRLAQDPTSEGLGMLKRNLIILKETDMDRFNSSIQLLQKHKLVPQLINELQLTNKIMI